VQRLRFDLGFFGARALNAADGLMEANIEEGQLKQQMMHACGVVVGIVDSSKFGTTSFSAFALPHEIHRIITDIHAPPSVVMDLRAQGIAVDLV
jgi:DeoR/GlpR family transcriptional regulator of sugar metabolism